MFHRNLIFPLSLRYEESLEVYVRLKTDGTVKMPLHLWSARAFTKKDQTYLLTQGIYIGAMVIMFCYNFFLMFVIIAVATDTRAVGVMAGAAIGATVMLCAFFGGPVTGASMNPARTLAPALFEGRLSVFWIYLLGPAIGAITAACLYEWIRGEADQKVQILEKSDLVQSSQKRKKRLR